MGRQWSVHLKSSEKLGNDETEEECHKKIFTVIINSAYNTDQWSYCSLCWEWWKSLTQKVKSIVSTSYCFYVYNIWQNEEALNLPIYSFNNCLLNCMWKDKYQFACLGFLLWCVCMYVTKIFRNRKPKVSPEHTTATEELQPTYSRSLPDTWHTGRNV